MAWTDCVSECNRLHRLNDGPGVLICGTYITVCANTEGYLHHHHLTPEHLTIPQYLCLLVF